MVDLTKKPFNLSKEEIEWVEKTYESMTLDEKIGQLFILLKPTPKVDENQLKDLINKSHLGGFRWQNLDTIGAYRQNALLQKLSKVPVLVAGNCDDGGNGVSPTGTFVATPVECGASNNEEHSYNLGYVSSKESSALGVNILFNPVVDVYMNWRNTIVNTRAFSDDPDKVIKHARSYIKGVKDANPNMGVTIKHFPGDGVEELDQHLSLAVNTLDEEKWDNSFGKVYKTLIEEGAEAVMIGHIALPCKSKKYIKDYSLKDLKPATLDKTILVDVLREELGFNGLIVTDASHMAGLAAMEKRSDYVPNTIIAGCDMFLFANDIEEDISYMKAAYLDGRLTETRLHDALYRILGMKAHLKLHKEEVRVKDEADLKYVGCDEFKDYKVKAAEDAITLVKDTRNYLPLDINKQKRCYLVYVGNIPNSRSYIGDPVKNVLIEELQNAGFEVEVSDNFHDLEVQNGPSFMNTIKMMTMEKREVFKSKHDFVLLVINVKGYAQENNVRLRWSCNHSKELFWYNEEVPTIAMSLNYTNHLIDIAPVHTYINAYAPSREVIRVAISKIKGESPFKGEAQENVFCDRIDTRL